MPDAQVIPFPAAPLARPVLQPSVHARGARPYLFIGRADDWHAPGVLTTRGETRAAADAAWMVERVLGVPKTQLPFPGVPHARELAFQYANWWKTPDGLQLRHYQAEGAAFLAERDYAVLCDQMGIGKTSQALVAAEARLALAVIQTADTPCVLVLCPALAKRHWQREVKRWTGYDAAIIDGLRTDDGVPRARYVIVNYDILYGARRKDAAGVMHDVANLPGWGGPLAQTGFVIMICDEAHILRGRSSQRTLAVRDMSAKIQVAWGLTGTLMPNYVRDLWPVVDTLTRGLWGNYWPWAKKFAGAIQGTYGWDDKGQDNLDELSKRMTMFILGRTKDSVGLQLPPMTREVYKVDVELSAPTVHDGVAAKERVTAVASAFRLTARAKRSAVIGQAVEALQAKQKVVVFLYTREQCDAVGKAIHDKVDCTTMIVHGDMTPDGRDRMAQTFREASAPAAFVATIDSVGIAISLVGADLVIFGDLVAEPWKLLQAEKRCHRFDSKVSVLIRYMIATGTLDETLAESVVEKLGVLEAAMGGQNETTELSTVLGGRSTQDIVDDLFAKLKAWKTVEDNA